MTPELMVAGAIMVAITFYAILGGADFGGGIWDLLATGKSADRQRALISEAIAPIWEANHVWLIVVIVLLFTGFPPAFAAVMIYLHIPLTLMLVGIVLRGAAFTFRHYDSHNDQMQRRWGLVFSIASTITPVTLGLCVGAIASGKIHSGNPKAVADVYSAWLAPFPFSVGALALALFAFIAAIYLTVEAPEDELREAFRIRALISSAAVFLTAWVAFFLSADGAPRVRAGLLSSAWSLPFQAVTGLAALGGILALWNRRYILARILGSMQAVLILWGWGMAQFPYLIEPDFTIENSAGAKSTMKLVLIALGAGAFLLFPSFYILYRLFKGESAFKVVDSTGTIILKRPGPTSSH